MRRCRSHILIDCNGVEDDEGYEPEASHREPNNGMGGEGDERIRCSPLTHLKA